MGDCLQLDSDLTSNSSALLSSNKQNMVSNFKACIVCDQSIDSKLLSAHHALHIQAGGLKISSDAKDYVVTTCAICNDDFTLTHLRTHTIKVHNIQIGKYKAQHSVKVVKKMFHQCHICNELILHDPDSIGTHLGKHKEYTEKFIQRMKPGRAAKQNDTRKAKQAKVEAGEKGLLASAMMETLDLPPSTFSTSTTPNNSPFTSPVT